MIDDLFSPRRTSRHIKRGRKSSGPDSFPLLCPYTSTSSRQMRSSLACGELRGWTMALFLLLSLCRSHFLSLSLTHTQTCMPGIQPAPPPLVEDPYVSRAKHRVGIFIIFTLDYTRPRQWSLTQHCVFKKSLIKMSSFFFGRWGGVYYFHPALTDMWINQTAVSFKTFICISMPSFVPQNRAGTITTRPRQNNHNALIKRPEAQDQNEIRYHMGLLDICFYIRHRFSRAKVTGVIRCLNPNGFGDLASF